MPTDLKQLVRDHALEEGGEIIEERDEGLVVRFPGRPSRLPRVGVGIAAFVMLPVLLDISSSSLFNLMNAFAILVLTLSYAIVDYLTVKPRTVFMRYTDHEEEFAEFAK